MHSKFPLASLIACSVTIVSALFSGCGSSSHKTPSPSPGPSGPSSPGTSTASFSVTAVAPAAGATQVPLTASVQITFSSAATASTVSVNTIKVTDPKPVAGTVSYKASTNTATFTPSAALAANSTYTVAVSGVTGTNGASLANPFTWSFATVTGASAPAPAPTPSASAQYQAPLISFGGGGSNLDGQVSIDTAGNMSLQLTGATANTTYSVQFCTAASSVPCKGNPTPMCFSVGSVSTDANGSGSLAGMFPKAGSWAGDFEVKSSSKVYYETFLVPGLNGETFMSTLQPSSTVNGTGLGSTCTAGASTTQAPLTSGTVTYAKGSATYTVTGTSPNMGFAANESETTYVDGSGTYPTDTFTTNASGDATSSSTSFGPGGDLFQVNPSNVSDGVGFIGGFSIPKQP